MMNRAFLNIGAEQTRAFAPGHFAGFCNLIQRQLLRVMFSDISHHLAQGSDIGILRKRIIRIRMPVDSQYLTQLGKVV